MAYGTLKDYVERLSLFLCYKVPKYLGQDEEFAYFEFRRPVILDRQQYKDPYGVLPDGWMHDMVELLVYTGVEHTGVDDVFNYFKCRVPMCIMKSPWGIAYFAPNMKISNEMMPPTPDHVRAADLAFEKAKNKLTTKTLSGKSPSDVMVLMKMVIAVDER